MKRMHFLKVILFEVVFIEGRKHINNFILLENIVSPEPQIRLWKQKTESENLVAGSSVQKNTVLEKSAAIVTAIPSPMICRA